jgi:GTP-binding protein
MIKARQSGAARKGTALPKIYYATQVAVNPITILMFVNKPELFDDNYRRFMVSRLQEMLPIEEVPIRLLARLNKGDARQSQGNQD